MTTLEEIREHCAARLLTEVERTSHVRAFIGLDGFIDEIIHVVDKRHDAESYERLSSMKAFSQRLAAAAGKSTNIELVNQQTKLGGNGPIMANAMARLGVKVTYLGTLGYPNLHPVFHEFAARAEVHSLAEPGHTDALEFDDGKVMLTKTAHFNQLNWSIIQSRMGMDLFQSHFASSELVAFVNWTMIPYMSDIWEAMLEDCCPQFSGPRRKIFFDLADPEKRSRKDLLRALGIMRRFQDHFDVILGLNEKESAEVGAVLDLDVSDSSRDGLRARTQALQKSLPLYSIVVHPVTYALAASQGEVSCVDGPFVEKPLITTGAGDHFNSGFCLGKLLGLDDSMSLLTGVAASGFYVRNAISPRLGDLAHMMQNWPQK